MGWMYPPAYGKSKEFYAKKRAKALAKIEKLEALVAICDDALSKK